MSKRKIYDFQDNITAHSKQRSYYSLVFIKTSKKTPVWPTEESLFLGVQRNLSSSISRKLK